MVLHSPWPSPWTRMASGPYCLVHPLYFIGDDGRGLVPGNSLVLALAAVLRVPLAVGVPVDPLQRILDPVGRKGPFLISQGEGAGQRFHQRFQGLAVPLYLPGVELLSVIFPVVVERPDPDCFAVFDIDGAFAAAAEQAAQRQGLDHRSCLALRPLFCFSVRHFNHSPFAIEGTWSSCYSTGAVW